MTFRFSRDRRDVTGQHLSLAARRRDTEQRIQGVAKVRGSRPADRVGCRQKRLDQSPFPVRRIACVVSTPPLIVAAHGFGPGHRDPRSVS